MAKNQSKQDTPVTLKLSERATLAACVAAIGIAFALMGVFFTASWLFFLLFLTDLVVLVSGKLSDTTKRFTLFISVTGAAVALVFAFASRPWIFQ